MTSIPLLFIWSIIGVFLFRHHMNKSDKTINEKNQSYYDKISQSTSSRKKDIDPEDFLHCTLTDEWLDGLDAPKNLVDSCKAIKDEPLLDYTGIENTDLMIKYGTANLSIISKYEENLNKLRDRLLKLADFLYTQGNTSDAISVLEDLLRLKECRSKSYKLLYEAYQKESSQMKIIQLRKEINEGNSPLKEKILKELKL